MLWACCAARACISVAQHALLQMGGKWWIRAGRVKWQGGGGTGSSRTTSFPRPLSPGKIDGAGPCRPIMLAEAYPWAREPMFPYPEETSGSDCPWDSHELWWCNCISRRELGLGHCPWHRVRECLFPYPEETLGSFPGSKEAGMAWCWERDFPAMYRWSSPLIWHW